MAPCACGYRRPRDAGSAGRSGRRVFGRPGRWLGGGAARAVSGAGDSGRYPTARVATADTRSDPSVAVLDVNGATIRVIDRLDDLLASLPSVAPVLSPELNVSAIALGPSPDDLLVAFTDGLLVRLPVDGDPTVIRGSGNLHDLRQVIWSPNGQALALIAAAKPGEPPGLFYAALRPDGIDPVRLAPAPGRTAGAIAWLPKADGILFTDSTGPLAADSLRAGRDLFVTPLRSDRRTLVAAAGRIGPAAGVGGFAIDPGGRSVAYTLYRASGDTVRFNSLWVGAVDGSQTVQVRLPAISDVAGLAWTGEGLMLLARPDGDGDLRVLLVGNDGSATSPLNNDDTAADVVG